MTLSKDNPEVTWKLNDLLEATRKAKSFAEESLMIEEEKKFCLADYNNKSNDDPVEACKNIDVEKVDNSAEFGETEKKENNKSFDGQDADENNATPNVLEQESEPIKNPNQILEQTEARMQIEEASFKNGYDSGFEDGVKKAENEIQKFEFELKNLLSSIEESAVSSNELYEPLKKLAMAIAVQIVRGELSVSSFAIERIIKGSLAHLDDPDDANILIYVSEFDRNQLEKHSIRFNSSQVKVDPQLSKGSVRLSMGDSIIEDLIETRLSEISEFVFNSVIDNDKDLNLNHASERQISDTTKSDSDVLEADIVESKNQEDEQKKDVEFENDSD